jgi:hypothetical protein
MNNFAERWDCRRLRFSAMEEVTKNVRRPAAMAAGLDRRRGMDMAAFLRMARRKVCDGCHRAEGYLAHQAKPRRLKPHIPLGLLVARLKTCPDTTRIWRRNRDRNNPETTSEQPRYGPAPAPRVPTRAVAPQSARTHAAAAFCRSLPHGGVCVIELLSVMEPEPVEVSATFRRVYDDHEIEARLIQSSLLPTHGLSRETVEIAFRFKPFGDVGGDFADFFQLPDGLIHLYLGDVVGKGLPAAMYSALAMGTLRGIHKTGTDTMKVLALLNQRLVQRPIPGRVFSTM